MNVSSIECIGHVPNTPDYFWKICSAKYWFLRDSEKPHFTSRILAMNVNWSWVLSDYLNSDYLIDSVNERCTQSLVDGFTRFSINGPLLCRCALLYLPIWPLTRWQVWIPISPYSGQTIHQLALACLSFNIRGTLRGWEEMPQPCSQDFSSGIITPCCYGTNVITRQEEGPDSKLECLSLPLSQDSSFPGQASPIAVLSSGVSAGDLCLPTHLRPSAAAKCLYSGPRPRYARLMNM